MPSSQQVALTPLGGGGTGGTTTDDPRRRSSSSSGINATVDMAKVSGINLQGDNTRERDDHWPSLPRRSPRPSCSGSGSNTPHPTMNVDQEEHQFSFGFVNSPKNSPDSRSRRPRKLSSPRMAILKRPFRLLTFLCCYASAVAAKVRRCCCRPTTTCLMSVFRVLANAKVAAALSLFAIGSVCLQCRLVQQDHAGAGVGTGGASASAPVEPVDCVEAMKTCAQHTSDGFPNCHELMHALSLECLSGPPIDITTSMALLLERLRATEVQKPEYFQNPLQEMPLVTIIVPTYNTESLLVPSLKSLLTQTYENIEIFLVDDGSTDATLEVAARIAASDPRVTLLTVPTGGGSGPYWAKNYAIMRSSGKYITYQDSDDISHPMRIEFQVRYLESNPEVVYCSPMYVRLTPNFELVGNRGVLQRLSFQSVMFPRRVVDEIGYMDSVRVSGDDEFFARLRVVYGHKARRRIDIVEQATGVRIPMYFAYRRVGSLTLNSKSGYDISREITGDRREYINRYTGWYEKMIAEMSAAAGGEGRRASALTGRSFVYMDFPLRFRPFSVPQVHRISTPFDNQMVIASMDTCKHRGTSSLRESVASIAPYVDDLYIYLNDLTTNSVLPITKKFPNVHLIASDDDDDDTNIADRGRFYPIASHKFTNAYLFTLSDRIVYPPDYVRKMIVKVERYGRKHVVGVHCVQLNSDQPSYYEGRVVRPFTSDLHSDKTVHILGTGTTAWHSDALPDLDLDMFTEAGMSDIHFAVHAKQQNVTMTCVKRDNAWLQLVDGDSGGSGGSGGAGAGAGAEDVGASGNDDCMTEPVDGEDSDALLKEKRKNQMRTDALREVFSEMFIS